jgi:hypothetical protein
MSGSTGAGDNHLDAATGSLLAPLNHLFWGAVSRENLYLEVDTKIFKGLSRI